MTEVEILIASIRTRVGQIKYVMKNLDANTWLRIEIACDKLIETADMAERRNIENVR